MNSLLAWCNQSSFLFSVGWMQPVHFSFLDELDATSLLFVSQWAGCYHWLSVFSSRWAGCNKSSFLFSWWPTWLFFSSVFLTGTVGNSSLYLVCSLFQWRCKPQKLLRSTRERDLLQILIDSSPVLSCSGLLGSILSSRPLTKPFKSRTVNSNLLHCARFINPQSL